MTNVALNRTTMVDSTLPPYNGSFAVDGNTVDAASRWISDIQLNTMHWIAVDLGQIFTLLRFAVYASPQYGTSAAQYQLCPHTISVRTLSPPTPPSLTPPPPPCSSSHHRIHFLLLFSCACYTYTYSLAHMCIRRKQCGMRSDEMLTSIVVNLQQVWNGSSTTSFADAVNSGTDWVVVSQRLTGSLQEGVEHDDILPTPTQYVRLDVNNTACKFFYPPHDENKRLVFKLWGRKIKSIYVLSLKVYELTYEAMIDHHWFPGKPPDLTLSTTSSRFTSLS